MIELVTTSGLFALDGGEWEVTNNIWLIGNDTEVAVIDAAHDHAPIVEAINGRLVRAIIALGESLGMLIVAEGIETEAQRLALVELGCAVGQGFLFSHPLSSDAVMALTHTLGVAEAEWRLPTGNTALKPIAR